MFIAKSKFKGLLKEAYKQGRLNVGMDKNELCYIDGILWHMEIPKECLSNAIKAQIVELTGELPAAGEAFTYKKDGKQCLMLETMQGELWRQYEEKVGIPVKETRLSIRTDSGNKVIFQGEQLHDAWLIPEEFVSCIDPGEMDRDETMRTPKIVENAILYAGNQMAFKHLVHTPKFMGEEKILSAIDGLNMAWSQSDEERI